MEIYVKEMPKSCKECPCSFQDVATCKWCNAYNKGKLTYISDDTYSKERFEDCPLKLLKDHDKELMAKVLERIKKYLFEKCDFDYGYYVNDGEFTISDLFSFLDQIQKEFEDGNNKN